MSEKYKDLLKTWDLLLEMYNDGEEIDEEEVDRLYEEQRRERKEREREYWKEQF